MTVKDGTKYIESINNDIKQIQKFLNLSEEEKKNLEEKLELNTTIIGLVNMSINCMVAYSSILKKRIDETTIKDM